MKIRYIRRFMKSYMVIAQRKPPVRWELMMMTQLALESVLFAEYVCEDGEAELWYDITGKQSLDVLLDDGQLTCELLCRILMGVYDAAEGLEGGLLRSEGLLLRPEYMFSDYGTEHIGICYDPENEIPVEQAFSQLMEYLLIKLDHEDPRAVELAYGIYEQSVKGGWNLSKIKDEIHLSYQSEEEYGEEKLILPKEQEEDQKQEQNEQSVKGGWNLSKIKDEIHLSYQSEEEYGEEKLILPKEQEEDQKQEQMIEELHRETANARLLRLFGILKVQKVLCEKLEQWKVGIGCILGRGTKKEAEETFVFEPEQAEETVSRPTVLLKELGKKAEGILRYEGVGKCENLVITGEEYIIGSDEGCAGYIPSKTVSRRHARITRVEDIYFVEDLNSLNGTRVGGELLNYKTRVSLQKNEMIAFADQKFRFI